ncbi:hypothetical protein LTR35_013176 [Friedmanniomyces endolithicus]|uniref:Inner centromere protein ARK-binding domain-containing protein n=1 Tax=Friedmanniomyces endolithicus TaxID=329885 RepID=A0AAN6G212_9PEZI|nr:hypothetical protein LTR35_013176 [Friedmanniomyces endolithicus]KAK0298454.1 hypothetical protein LTS00_002834 [Friedmanniomyces endolithicus]KAK0327703.1 hypothetical protein LTR82_001220 [Friedmanniomyces endolithicus]KAK0989378.1 hypothetical protein LTR54_012497 [Friedmanniomyces endolithicus]
MAALRTKGAPVGSAQWIQSEREHAAHMIDEEAQELSYSVRNELEWLNEHLADVFSRNNVTLIDTLKTPGKLRGKTPRTARKRDIVQAPRQPLTDIFAPNASAPPTQPSARKNNAFYDKVAQFQIAEDQEYEENAPDQLPISHSESPKHVSKPANVDSGYHGMTDKEVDIDGKTETATASSQESEGQSVPVRVGQARPQAIGQGTGVDGEQINDESFTSAKEEIRHLNAPNDESRGEPDAESGDVEMLEEADPDEEPVVEEGLPAAPVVPNEHDVELMDEDAVDDTPRTTSDGASSPGKPLQRKSSFTFSALPAREPLTAKQSFGFRDSQIDPGHHSVLARSFGTNDAGVVAQNEAAVVSPEEVEETKMHHKTTTQLLQERISMLGMIKEPRMSKSVLQNVLGAPATYPRLPPLPLEPEVENVVEAAVSANEDTGDEVEAEDEDDDWIAPSKPAVATQRKSVVQTAPSSHTPQGSPKRPAMHQKSISTTQMPSPSRPVIPAGHQKAQSVSHPNLANAAGMMSSTTPIGSPIGKKHHDGPLSASKNKLWSAFKSAKNIFASSASASAAAKLEAHNSPAAHRSPKRDFSDESKTAAVYNMPGAMYSEQQLPSKAASIISASPSRKTRGSNESDKKREKELKAQQKADSELEKAREKERVKAMKQQEERRKADEAEAGRKERMEAERPMSAGSDRGDMPPPPPPKSMLPVGKLRAPGRPVKPARAPEPAGRPVPVNIRVASQSQRLGPVPNASLSRSQQESLAPPPPPKTNLRTASAQGSVRGSTAPLAGNARGVRALEAAAKKREADEKATAKKAEQKRELERKRTAKAEEERRAAEQARVQEAKLVAQRKAMEAEVLAKRKEALRQQQEADEKRKVREAHELADAIQRERSAWPAAPQHQRGDVGGTLRQLAKNTVPGPQTNAARPAPTKRTYQPEDDELQRPGLQRGPPSYQQNDAKRRRTNEEEHEERHSVMAPPKRPSNMRKESTLNKFPHGYTHAPPPAAHHAMTGGSSSMFKSTVTAQHQLQHTQGKQHQIPTHPSQTVQLSSARIPFAENANPSAAAQHSSRHQQQMYPGHENAHPATGNPNFKTPGRPAQAPKGAKSSPLYPNGDAIQLPEIMTDSEDEDSEDEAAATGFRAPSWVASPALRDLLTQQQLVDPETVFGPIGELKMEEVFKGGKNAADRLKRFRDRGSSAAWAESGDLVTSAEKRKDNEARERVVRDGGWRFEPAT